MSELLGYLRALVRRFSMAIIVTHHIAKSGNKCGGQVIRGSGDLHEFIDSAIFLEKHRDTWS